MKRKRLNLGQSDFKNISTGNNYYIDKSLLIEEIINVEQSVLLLPRPRRFGKTLNLSMLRYFFDKNELENQKLFTELKIWQCDEDIKKHCGKYAVIYLSFKDAKAETWEKTLAQIKDEIVRLYETHYYLIASDVLRPHEKNKFLEILNQTASETAYETSIKHLSTYLERFHHENVMILLDEYDTPIQASHTKFYTEAISFMRNLLSGAFKDNSVLYKGVITGILRVSRESIFTGLNNISVYSILESRFSDKFGFTEKEVKQILIDFELIEKYAEIKKWYNGYKFGKSENIYNPWSILSYVTSFEDGFKTFWSQTSANILIKEQINKRDAGNIREDILKLISGEAIVKSIEANFAFPDLAKSNDLLWTLLMYSGYLTTRIPVSRKEYELVIPNFEIKTIFQDTILEWLKTDVKIEKSLLSETFNYLITNEIEKFEQGFKEIIGDTFSYYDTVKTNEYIYHAYLLGLLAIIGDDYLIKFNKESGEGRYDIMLIPHDKSKNGVVIEIKQIEKQAKKESKKIFNNRINKQIVLAKAQIEQNKYYKELIDNKITNDNIIKIPIVFAGKEAFVIPK